MVGLVWSEIGVSMKVFISYAKEDFEQAVKCYVRLSEDGFTPWMDAKNLLPGQNWEVEIERALSDANLVILLLSKSSVSKRGFVQREANDAVAKLRHKQPADIYVIPLLVEPCDVPSYIADRLQHIDLSAPDAWDRVRSSIRLAAKQQSIDLAEGVAIGPLRVFTEKIEDRWLAGPGHDIAIKFPRFEWSARPDVAKELSNLFVGRAYETLIKSRQKPWDQFPEYFPEGNAASATNGRWDDFCVVHATEKFVSLEYEVWWYGAGAVHPNMHIETFNFSCDERVHILSLEDFFRSDVDVLAHISRLCIDQLCREFWIREGERPDDDQMKWFGQGAGVSAANFGAFTVAADHFTFHFAPYQAGPFAAGRWRIDVPFYDLLDYLRPDGPHMLAKVIAD